jgi:hypothetical protein
VRTWRRRGQRLQRHLNNAEKGPIAKKSRSWTRIEAPVNNRQSLLR